MNIKDTFAKLSEDTDRLNFNQVKFAVPQMQALMSFFRNSTAVGKLNKLQFVNCEIDEESMEVLLNGLKENLPIKSLNLTNIPMTGKGIESLLAALRTNKTLESLALCNVDTIRERFDAIVGVLRENKTLKWVGFGVNDMNLNAPIKFANEIPMGLVWFLDDAGKEKIALTQDRKILNSFNVNSGAISSVLEQMLGSVSSLERLRFANCDILDETIGLLSGGKSFKEISFINCRISPDVLNKLLKTLQTEQLFLIDGTVKQEGLPIIAESLKENKNLRFLSLRNNHLVDIAPLAEALEGNTTLGSLGVSDNPIGHLGLRTLCESIAKNSTLRQFSACNIGVDKNDRVGSIDPLKGRGTPLNIWLEDLRLPPMVIGGNQFIFRNIPINVETIRGLQANTNLKRLDFRNVEMTEEKLEAIAKTSKANKNIERIVFGANDMKLEGLIKLAKETTIELTWFLDDAGKEKIALTQDRKILNSFNVNSGAISSVLEQMLGSVSSLECLGFENCDILDETIGLLSWGKFFKEISFRNCRISSLEGLSKLKTEQLLLIDRTVKQEGLPVLQTSANLKRLDFRNVEMTEEKLEAIKALKAERLVFGVNDMNLEGLIKLANETSMELVWFLDDFGTESIELTQDRKRLRLYNVSSGAISFVLEQVLGSVSSLERLGFANCDILDETIGLLRGKSFKEIEFKGCCRISPNVWLNLSETLQTERLVLTNGTMKPECLPIIAKALKIEGLAFGANDMNLECLINLANKTHMRLSWFFDDAGTVKIELSRDHKSLLIHNMKLDISSVLKRMLVSFMSLEGLRFTNCDISDETIGLLCGDKSFEKVGFLGCRISSKGLSELSKASKIKKLWLINGTINQECLPLIAEALKVNKNLAWVLFSFNDISPEDLIEFSKETNIGLGFVWDETATGRIILSQDRKHLSIHNMRIDISSVLAQMLVAFTSLEGLRFTNCDISDKMVDLLCGDKSFEQVSFEGCRISSEGLGKLSKVSKIKKLWLTDETINQECLPIIAESLKENEGLQLLSLCNNHLENIAPLTEALKENTHLKALSISGNPIGEHGIVALFCTIAESPTIEQVCAIGVGVVEASRESLTAMLPDTVKVFWE